MRFLAYMLLFAASPALAVTLPAPPPTPAGSQPRAKALPDDFLDDVARGEQPAAPDDGPSGDRHWADDAASAAGEARAPRPGLDCPKPSGATGAILGAVAGGILGNVIDGGRHRAIGTLAGAGGGALLGRSIEQKSATCR